MPGIDENGRYARRRLSSDARAMVVRRLTIRTLTAAGDISSTISHHGGTAASDIRAGRATGDDVVVKASWQS